MFTQRQISMEILEQKGLGTELYYLEPNLNSSASFIVLGIKVFISSDELAKAIAALPLLRQEIILMSFFIDLNDWEIDEADEVWICSLWVISEMNIDCSGLI